MRAATPEPRGTPEAAALPPDTDLVARALAGDAAGFELLMRRHNQRLYRVARSVVRDEHEAEDVVQEAYVRAFTGMARFEGRSSVATWLTRIAYHEALRRRRRPRAAELLEGAVPEPPHPAADGPFSTQTPAETAETRTVLTQAIDDLPEDLRTVLVLRLVEGLGTRETAACLGMTEANVRVSLHRARRTLFDRLCREVDADLRRQMVFGADRCDRLVAVVFDRLAGEETGGPVPE